LTAKVIIVDRRDDRINTQKGCLEGCVVDRSLSARLVQLCLCLPLPLTNLLPVFRTVRSVRSWLRTGLDRMIRSSLQERPGLAVFLVLRSGAPAVDCSRPYSQSSAVDRSRPHSTAVNRCLVAHQNTICCQFSTNT
jgi:hypothetical protein